jgi:regulator of cell morphogenesis and NO signaling
MSSLDIKYKYAALTSSVPFAKWPLDLLMEYVLKVHHKGIRTNGPKLLQIAAKVKDKHGNEHPELVEVYELVNQSLQDLETHLTKEDQVLYPYLFELYEASENNKKIEQIHCGTIENPISVMVSDHDGEEERYARIIKLTNNFEVPKGACPAYRLLMTELEKFANALFEHIHLENNIIFPRCIELEKQVVQS